MNKLSRRKLLKLSAACLGGGLLPTCSFAKERKNSVFFLSAPSDAYYDPFFDEIVWYFQNFINAAHKNDLLLIVADRETRKELKGLLPDKHLIPGEIPDIWMRDYSVIQTKAGLFKFKYRPNYLKTSDAKAIEAGFVNWFRGLGLPFKFVDLVLDGGNFNYNGAYSALMTERIFADNYDKSEKEIIRLLRDTLALDYLAFLPEVPGDTTGHSDGMVKWLSKNKLAVSAFDDELWQAVMEVIDEDLQEQVEIVEMPYQPSNKYWRNFADANGVYVNALTTDNAIYVPMFGLGVDKKALAIFKKHADRAVIPVQVGKVGRMGGSVRCLTRQLGGVAAQRVINSVLNL